MDTRQNQNISIAKFYDTMAGTYYQERYLHCSSTVAFGLINRMSLVVHLLDKYGTRGGVLVDLGCGPANLFEPSHERGFEYTGIDISAKMVEEAKRRISQKARNTKASVIVGDTRETKLPDNFADVVTALGLMDYIKDENKFYYEIHRILKPGGIAILSYSNKISFVNLTRFILTPLARIMAKNRLKVMGNLETKKHRSGVEQNKLGLIGFETIETVHQDANLVPFSLHMPKIYFETMLFLERVFERLNFTFCLSSFVIVSRKKFI